MYVGGGAGGGGGQLACTYHMKSLRLPWHSGEVAIVGVSTDIRASKCRVVLELKQLSDRDS